MSKRDRIFVCLLCLLAFIAGISAFPIARFVKSQAAKLHVVVGDDTRGGPWAEPVREISIQSS
ncbi:MAG: hypothetical protein VXZ38_09100, partial [Planctomycetota bacterium]|nr:hypothetical protein [Planctomycetota bacterium]